MTRTRRSKKKPYQVDIGSGTRHVISLYWWDRYIAEGWLVQVSNRCAVLRKDVVGWIEDGKLRLLHKIKNIGVSIPSSWRWVERWAIYDDRGPRLTPGQMQREVWAQYVTV